MEQRPMMGLEIFKSLEARELGAFIKRSCPEEGPQKLLLEKLYRVCIRQVTPAPDWFDEIKKP